MIFAKTHKLVMSGRKVQTLRLAYFNDYLGETDDGQIAIYSGMGSDRAAKYHRPRWIVGHTYAVQVERCHRAIGRIRVTKLTEVLDPLAADDAFACREGFDSPNEFFRVWRELHPKQPVQRCWAIEFVLVGR